MKMKAGRAMVEVLESWDIDHIYGIPGGSINAFVSGLLKEKCDVEYIQVRHEEVGALAASADAKFTDKIGVCFGSAGPGATHLFNGLYDAKMDHVPMLAIVGQVLSTNLNTNYFQEMDEVPMFSDVTVYNRVAMNPEQLPYLIDEAIRSAYEHKGPAVVIVPQDYADTDIEFENTFVKRDFVKEINPDFNQKDIAQSVKLIKAAKKPVLFVGMGLKHARQEVEELSSKLNIPVVCTAPSTGHAVSSDFKNFMGSFGRLGTKPGFEVMQHADLVLFLGTNFPFARFWPPGKKYIEVNNNVADIGRQLKPDLSILGDAKAYVEALLDEKIKPFKSKWLESNIKNKENWDKWLDAIADDDSKGLMPEAVIREISAIADDDAIFGIDVGNNTMHSVRGLPLNKNRQFAISAWFATMGYGLPAGLAAKMSFPKAQAWSISGDGGFSMVMPDLITMVKYELPVINIVLSNKSLGFIRHEQIMEKRQFYGIDLQDADWAKAAEGLGAIGFTATNLKELKEIFKEVDKLNRSSNKKPIVVDAKIANIDPMDTSMIMLDTKFFDKKQVKKYQDTYNVFGQPPLGELL